MPESEGPKRNQLNSILEKAQLLLSSSITMLGSVIVFNETIIAEYDHRTFLLGLGLMAYGFIGAFDANAKIRRRKNEKK